MYLDLPMSNRGVDGYQCACCGVKHRTLEQPTAHAESCSKLQFLRTHRHSDIQLIYEILVGEILGVSWRCGSPIIYEHFSVRANTEDDLFAKATSLIWPSVLAKTPKSS